MGKHVQRKKFDGLELAGEALLALRDPEFHVSGIKITAEAYEERDGIWVYVTQEGDLVTGNEPILPEYEKVG